MLHPADSKLVQDLRWFAAKLRSRKIALVLRVGYFLLVALLFWSAASLRFQLPWWPIVNHDSWGYFHPAIAKFAGGAFEHTNGRNFLYPGFIFLVLATAKSLKAITFVQHLLGLACGALILASWERLRRFLHFIPRALHSLGGLAVAAIYLLTSRPVQYEHDLRPESITPFFAILNIFLTLTFFEQRFGRQPSRRAALTGALIVVNSVILAALKTSFVLSIVFSVVPVLVALADRREIWSRRLAVAAAGLCAVGAFAIPESLLGKADPETRAFLPVSLFSIHANLIAPQMEEDLARGECGSYGCEWLNRLATTLRDDMTRSWQVSKGYRSFGFDPDFLKYDRSSMDSWPRRFFGGDKDKMLQFCMAYYWRTVRHRPGAMLNKIVGQVGLFYAPRNPSFSQRKRVHMDHLYRDSAANFSGKGENAPEEPFVAEYVRVAEQLAQVDKIVRPPLLVRFANGLLAYAYRPVFFSLLLCAGIAVLSRTFRARNAAFLLVVLFLFSYNLGTVVGTAVLHSLHILRYNETQYAFSLFAVCGGILFLVELAFQLGAAIASRIASPVTIR